LLSIIPKQLSKNDKVEGIYKKVNIELFLQGVPQGFTQITLLTNLCCAALPAALALISQLDKERKTQSYLSPLTHM